MHSRVYQYGGPSRLIEAIQSNDMNLFKEILESFKYNNKEVDSIVNGRGNTALMCAAELGYISYMNMLLDYGADINRRNNYGDTCLLIAPLFAAETLLNRGSNYNLTNNNGHNILMKACLHKNNKIISKLLVYDDIDVNAQDCIFGFTALHWCAQTDNLKGVQLLLENPRCDKTVLDKDGRSAESLALYCLNYEVAKYIRDHEHTISY